MHLTKSFRTKTGYCHLLPDKLVLTREGFIGEAARITMGTGLTRVLTLYTLLAALLFYFAYDGFNTGNNALGLFFTATGSWLIHGVLSSLNSSATPVINRADIQQVILKRAIPGLTRSRFEVIFKENNRLKKRLIMLPGSFNDGGAETARAIELMKSENLL